MSINCPNSKCDVYKTQYSLVKDGTYFRKNDSRKVQRYKCQSCNSRFSAVTGTLEANQKKRRVNEMVGNLLCSSVSMRRISLILNIHRTTVSRKLTYLAKKSELHQEKYLKSLEQTPVRHIQIDDLITIEHTKLKPLTISVAVDAENRRILGAEVKPIAAFGHLSEISKRKYGKRVSKHKEGLDLLFTKIYKSISKNALIESDEHKFYPQFIAKYLPGAIHSTYKSEKGCVAGQGELKKIHSDPIFAINHTLAMLRANINRLVRRSWCTTKDPEMLTKHIQIYIHFHNTKLIRKSPC